jgi:hypothetical protein
MQDVINNLQNITDGFLTKDKFVNVYEKCGRMMHAENPFGGKIDYQFYEKSIPVWMEEVRILLNSHKIQLINDKNMYIIHMKEDNDDKVHGYTFAPVE